MKKLSLLVLVLSCAHVLQAQQGNLWYKDAIIYNLHVHTFKDSDGDGKGDFKGLTRKLDYIQQLGFNTIWLAPFYPSPYKDDGYDVSDFYGIDPSCGAYNDFIEFIQQAKQRKLRIVIDLVLNHTSDEHPWFRSARNDTASPYHHWYYWSAEKPVGIKEGLGFPGVQEAVWTMDEKAKQYYYHKFYDYQPHLNYTNKAVENEADSIFKYWLARGIDGFRLDAIPHVIEVPTQDKKKPDMYYELIPRLMQSARSFNKEVVLIGEANVSPKDIDKYFGKKGEGLNMMFSFFANQAMFYGLATGKVQDFIKALDSTRNIPGTAQWVNFLRNHDELGITKISEEKEQEVYKKFGPDKNMQVYDRGIRRRLAPMMNNNRAHLEMAYSLLFSLPGSPVVRYGEEIGMGDDLSLPERFSVRTPMQWDDTKHAGFSTADKTLRPVIDKGDYGYRNINVAQQLTDTASLLHFIQQLVALRKACPEIGRGKWQIVDTTQQHVLILRYDYNGKSLLTIHNFSDSAQDVLVSKGITATTIKTFFPGNETIQRGRDGFYIRLQPYAYKWMKL
jgi:maltose alpha-D-glucosyltransferase / alpha-amylase